MRLHSFAGKQQGKDHMIEDSSRDMSTYHFTLRSTVSKRLGCAVRQNTVQVCHYCSGRKRSRHIQTVRNANTQSVALRLLKLPV